jgi:gamma-glutamyl hydrolase
MSPIINFILLLASSYWISTIQAMFLRQQRSLPDQLILSSPIPQNDHPSTNNKRENTELLTTQNIHHPSSSSSSNRVPIVGILTQDYQEQSNTKQFISASYVKILHSIGARVIPLIYTWSQEEMADALKGLDGVLFAGGGQDITLNSPYTLAAKQILMYAESKNVKEKDSFAIWGICLGWELMSVLTARNYSILDEDFKHTMVAAPLQLLNRNNNRAFEFITPELSRAVEHESLSWFNHHMGVPTRKFFINKLMTSTYRVLALAKDSNGKSFIAAVEGINRPYFGVQYHPNSNPFEPYAAIPHSQHAIDFARLQMDFFGRLLRTSKTTEPKFEKGDWEADSRDIQRVPLTFRGIEGMLMSGLYLFDDNNK